MLPRRFKILKFEIYRLGRKLSVGLGHVRRKVKSIPGERCIPSLRHLHAAIRLTRCSVAAEGRLPIPSTFKVAVRPRHYLTMSNWPLL
jgi:hypothetical protein